jgi:hypothetical protein
MFSGFTKRKGLEADFRAENEAQKSENDFDICAKKPPEKTGRKIVFMTSGL